MVTIAGCVLAIGTAVLASSFSNLMDYIQALASFVNAPLFAIFILGLFWKRMTPTSGWTALLSGTVAAVLVDVLVRTGVIGISNQAGSFVGASLAFVVCLIVGYAVSMFTEPKPDEELTGLVWSLTPRPKSADLALEDTGWYRSPIVLGMGVLIITIVLYIVFW